MKYFSLIIRNLVRKPGRTTALILLTAFLAMSVFCGTIVVSSLRRGLSSMENRLGADIIVVPSEAESKVSLKNLLLQGTIGTFYMDASAVEKVQETEGVEKASAQIFLSSMKADCCSVRVQIIGFDPDNDFVVQPWVAESLNRPLGDMEVVVGCRVDTEVGNKFRIYDRNCLVVAKLASTGTGLDTAVYCTLPTIRTLMTAAEDLGGYSPISGDPSETVSAVYIKVKEGVDPKDVADSINVHVRKVKAVQTRSVITTVADSLSGLERILTLLIIAAAVLVWLVLFAAFTLMTGERKKEFATLRLCGLSRGRLAGLVFREAAIVSLLGSAAGVGLSLLLVHAFSGALGNALGLPFLLPSAGTAAALALAAFLGCLLAGPLAAAVSARKLSRADTGLILREG